MAPALGTSPRAIGLALTEHNILLVFDNCEHMLGGVAGFVEAILSLAPGVHVLATSREALRANGEKVVPLSALDFPSDATAVSPGIALGFSAVQLLVERAEANSADFRLTDENTLGVIEICRRLDGLPLAIELAAAWVAFFGVDGLARRLDSHFLAAKSGRRSALPHHQTLVAMLDWSYDALTDKERRAFDRLSVFRAGFTLDTAIAVLADDQFDDRDVASSLAKLVGKSLVSVEMNLRVPEYRLLETTRSYVASKFAATDGQRAVRQRHAARCLGLLGRADVDLVRFGRKSWVGLYGGLAADALVALDWAFSDSGDIELGIALTAAASAVFGEQLLLHQEYHARIQMALDRMNGRPPRYAAVEHELRLTLGHLLELKGEEETAYLLAVSSLQGTGGPTPNISPKDLARQWSATWVSGRYPEATAIANAMGVLGDQLGDAKVKMVANRIMAQSLHSLGRNAEAKRLAQTVLDSPFIYLPFTNVTHKISMRIVLARIAFLEGDAGAADRVKELMALGESDNPVALCQIMGTAAIPMAIWSDDIGGARAMTERLASLGSASSMGFWNVFSEQLRIAVGLRSGSIRVRPSRAMGFNGECVHPMVTDLTATLDWRLLTQATVERVEEGRVGWCAPEIIRLNALAKSDIEGRERRLHRALSMAQASNSVFWERRIQESLA